MDGWERPDNAHAEAGWLIADTIDAHYGRGPGHNRDRNLIAGGIADVDTQTFVVYPETGQGADLVGIPADTSPALTGVNAPDRGVFVVFAKAHRSSDADDPESWTTADVAPTLNTSDVGDQRSTVAVAAATGVRRLTPRECERLMGWPDDFTRWTADGHELADGHRYRMCGNGVVAPVSEWIGRRLVAAVTS
jgi:site-specific DNA-cytosine methylase